MECGQDILVVFNAGVSYRTDYGVDFGSLLGFKLA